MAKDERQNSAEPVFPVKFCPSCGHSLLEKNSLINEYWVSENNVYFCWCSYCSWRGDIIEITRVTAPELTSD